MNKEYLIEQAAKIKREEEEREELIRRGIDPDRKKKNYRKKQNRNLGQNGTALEAIEKVVQVRYWKCEYEGLGEYKHSTVIYTEHTLQCTHTTMYTHYEVHTHSEHTLQGTHTTRYTLKSTH